MDWVPNLLPVCVVTNYNPAILPVYFILSKLKHIQGVAVLLYINFFFLRITS